MAAHCYRARQRAAVALTPRVAEAWRGQLVAAEAEAPIFVTPPAVGVGSGAGGSIIGVGAAGAAGAARSEGPQCLAAASRVLPRVVGAGGSVLSASLALLLAKRGGAASAAQRAQADEGGGAAAASDVLLAR
eukprot:CAMPEP_0115554986 /NCGR_PEP_ID=MMETSP0271-20121206/97580_1 /TAXON_ID=71861 /ORGANISM="Scrippsiella trochoidea, Strain CCMP3099" /LENGTH=131 /DNA_ID=CAMNT_0002988737 /DNA_START=39 /DNA_END=431 /DNA_ORIENTATION=-